MSQNTGPAPLGRPLVVLSSTGSTNTELMRGNYTHGAALLALSQTAGRGRLGRSWADMRGDGLALSVLLSAGLTPDDLLRLPVLCVTAARRALGPYTGGACRIKWPNDLLVGGKKLGGILCESKADPALQAVCGFGINLTQASEFFELHGLTHATSLAACGGTAPPPLALARRLLAELSDVWAAYTSGDFAPLLDEYRSHSIAIGRAVAVNRQGVTQTGRCVDIDDNGALVCEFCGIKQTIMAGEVVFDGIYGHNLGTAGT